MWNPTLAKDVEPLEMSQHRAVRFIVRLRGWESVTEPYSELSVHMVVSPTEIQKSQTISSDENPTG